MFPILDLQNAQVAIAGLTGVLGLLSMLLGLYILVARGYSHELGVLAAQSAKLGQKGVGDGVTALVEQSAQLVEAINNLVRTAAGIGVFLVLTGMVLLSGSYYIVARLSFLV